MGVSGSKHAAGAGGADMTVTNNDWPGEPGVPMNPEQSGWHWVSWGDEGPCALEWGSEHWFRPDEPGSGHWCFGGGQYGTAEEIAADGWTYLGPVLSHDQATALQARVAELEGALRPFAELGRFVVEHHPDPETDLNHEMSALVRHFRNDYTALEGKKDSPTMTEGQLREMMRDPRYWRQRNPEWVKRVTDGFRALVGGKKDER